MDDELIYKFNQGDPKALEAVYKKFYRQLIYFAFKLTLDEMKAEEIVHDSFLRVTRYTAVKSIGDLERLLFKILRNSCLDYLRQRDRVRRNMSYYYLFKEDSEEMKDVAKEELEYSKLINSILELIAEQPVQRKKVLEYILKGMTAKQVAYLLNIHVSNVYKHRDAFREVLEKKNIKDLTALL